MREINAGAISDKARLRPKPAGSVASLIGPQLVFQIGGGKNRALAFHAWPLGRISRP
jgi:hypothetical protein